MCPIREHRVDLEDTSLPKNRLSNLIVEAEGFVKQLRRKRAQKMAKWPEPAKPQQETKSPVRLFSRERTGDLHCGVTVVLKTNEIGGTRTRDPSIKSGDLFTGMVLVILRSAVLPAGLRL